MLTNFQKDLEQGKEAEMLIYDLAAKAGYNAEWVADLPQYRYKGDIKVMLPTGKEIFIEVKNDTVIHKTHNILCEEEVYYKESGYMAKGNMCCNSDYFVIVSQQDRKVYVLDFKVLQSIYRKGDFKQIHHAQQYSNCYLLELCRAKQWGALIDTFNY